MASKRRLRRKQCGKVAYPDLESAVKAAGVARWRTHGDRIWAYRCPWCGQYHIGHATADQVRAQRARWAHDG